nr:MAG TPA: antirestriction protein [Caudoviricetes sp.]
MRNYTINTTSERTATIRNLYNGDEFTIAFPFVDDEHMESAIRRATSNGEHDYIIADLDGFYNFVDSEFTNIEELSDLAERIEALEDDDAEKLEAMAEYCDDLDDVERAWDDSYFIPDTTLADYAEELAYECGYIPCDGLPGWISCHIDWEGIGRELSVDGYSEINGGVLYVAR